MILRVCVELEEVGYPSAYGTKKVEARFRSCREDALSVLDEAWELRVADVVSVVYAVLEEYFPRIKEEVDKSCLRHLGLRLGGEP